MLRVLRSRDDSVRATAAKVHHKCALAIGERRVSRTDYEPV